MSLEIYWTVVDEVIDSRSKELVGIVSDSLTVVKSNQVYKCSEEDLTQTVIVNNNPTALKELLENTKKARDL